MGAHKFIFYNLEPLITTRVTNKKCFRMRKLNLSNIIMVPALPS